MSERRKHYTGSGTLCSTHYRKSLGFEVRVTQAVLMEALVAWRVR